MTDDTRFTQAIARLDAANSEDPNRLAHEGRDYPAELLYGLRMTAWLERLQPAASVALRLAARGQHVRRWHVPRSKYPMTRAGYHQWRTSLARFHADEAGEILRAVGYDDATISRVQSLLRKERLKTDPETQTLEDVACLVFLEHYFADFAARHEEPKVIEILRRTWRKMSDAGHRAALELVATLPERPRTLVGEALQNLGTADERG